MPRIEFRCFKLNFRINLLVCLFFMAVFIALLNLADWQRQRMGQKQAIVDAWQQQMQAQPVNVLEIGDLDKADAYRPLNVTGTFDNEHIILLDNRVHNGQVGYHVLQPLKVTDSYKWLLVDRGWVAGNPDRQILPTIDPVTQPVSLNGRLIIPSEKVFSFTPNIFENDSFPSRIQYVKIAQLSYRLNYEFLPFLLAVDPDSKYTFTYNQSPMYLTPERHKGYALQWLALAITWLLLGVVLTIRKDKSSND